MSEARTWNERHPHLPPWRTCNCSCEEQGHNPGSCTLYAEHQGQRVISRDSQTYVTGIAVCTACLGAPA